MHLGSLPGLLLALAWGLLGGSFCSTHNYNRRFRRSKQSYRLFDSRPGRNHPHSNTRSSCYRNVGRDKHAPRPRLQRRSYPRHRFRCLQPLPWQARRDFRLNPLDWNFLNSAPRDPAVKMGPFAYVYLVLMIALIAGGIYGYRVLRPRYKNTNPVWYRAVARFAQPLIWIGVIGLFFLLARLVELDFFNKRIWMYLTLVAVLGVGGWFYYWYRDSYPKEMAKFQKTQKQKQYMPGGSRPSPHGPRT